MTTPGSVATVATAPRVPAPGGLRDIGHRLVGVTTPSMWFRVGAHLLAAAVLFPVYLRLSDTGAENSDMSNILLMASGLLQCVEHR